MHAITFQFRTELYGRKVKTTVVEPELKFPAPTAGIYIFGSGSNLWKFLAPDPGRFDPLKAKNKCIICTTRLPHKLCLLNGNPNFRLRLHHLKFLAPAPQPWSTKPHFDGQSMDRPHVFVRYAVLQVLHRIRQATSHGISTQHAASR